MAASNPSNITAKVIEAAGHQPQASAVWQGAPCTRLCQCRRSVNVFLVTLCTPHMSCRALLNALASILQEDYPQLVLQQLTTFLK